MRMYDDWLTDFTKRHEHMRKPYSNPQEAQVFTTDEEIEKVEVIRPEVIIRWRRIGVPEPTIQALIKQHQRATEARRIEKKIRIPELDYPVPQLPKVEEAAKVMAMALDTDGWLEERRAREDKVERIDRWVYRWEYRVPATGFGTDTYKLTEHIADMLNTSISVVRVVYLGRATIIYRTLAWSSRGMRVIQLCEPHFIKHKERARLYLERYRSRPTRPEPRPPL